MERDYLINLLIDSAKDTFTLIYILTVYIL